MAPWAHLWPKFFRFWFHAEQIETVQDESNNEEEKKEKESDIIYKLSLGAILLSDTGK